MSLDPRLVVTPGRTARAAVVALALPALLAVRQGATKPPGGCVAPPFRDVQSLVDAGRYWHALRVARPLPGPPRPLNPADALLHLRIAEGLGLRDRVDGILARVRGADTIPEYLAAGARQDERAGRWPAATARYRRLAALRGASAALVATAATRLAVVWERRGAHDSAAAAWRRAAQLLPEVADWFALRRAELEDDTALAFASAADARTPGALERADDIRARRREAAGNLKGALEIYLRRGRALDAARVEVSLGRRDPARQIVDSLLLTDPAQPIALLAANLLVERFGALTAAELVGVARAFRARGDRATAERYARRAVATKDTGVAGWVELATVRAARREFHAALVALDSAELLRRRRHATEATAIARARVQVLGAADRWGDARELADRLSRANPGDTDVAAAVLYVANRERLRGAPLDERALYLQLVQRFPATFPALLARFRLALGDYAAGRVDAAQSALATVLAQDTARRLGRSARFWQARINLERRDPLAWDALRVIVAEEPTGYYGVRGEELLGDSLSLAPDTMAPVFPGGFPASRARERVQLLARIGLEGEARAEAAGWMKDARTAGPVLVEAAGAAADAGYAREAIQLGEAARKRSGLSREVALAIFPLPYRRVVEAEAAEQCVDPWLLAAIVRQESRFDPRAQSRAGARGLSQVLPRTGAELSRTLRLGPWNPAYLFDPDFNLHLGARYIRWLVLDALPMHALLASYNLGRTRIVRGRGEPEFHDPDLFVERLPFNETRDYVRNVYANYRWYRRLYGAAESVP